ncbi:MAG: hypothetical protein MO846_01940 [Candidatus Devosia symbiotica]|nr:hypothetical protein [Candidatus Devosia symbiotica]
MIRDADGSELPYLEATKHNTVALAKAIVEHAASAGADTRVPRSIEITDAAGEELLYVVFWARPKLDDGPETPVDTSKHSTPTEPRVAALESAVQGRWLGQHKWS